MLTDADRVPLSARGWIADGVGGALVAADGTIDWYARERLDAPPVLGRLLDGRAGAVRIGLRHDGTGARRRLPPASQAYRPGTLIVETEQRGGGAAVRITDLLPWPGARDTPEGRVVRVVTVLAGPAEVEIEVVPGRGFSPASRVAAWSEGVVFDGTVVRSGLPLLAEPTDRDHPRWRAVLTLPADGSLVVTVDQAGLDRHEPLSLDAALRLVETTAAAWRSWLAPLVYDGQYRAAVERAALTVRSLTATSAGAPIAAATTSLPRRPGGERTDDDRVVRWRDAAAAVAALAAVGLPEDAEAAEGWLRQAADGTTLPWPPALCLDGQVPGEVEELPAEGWRRSQPVVVGRRPGLVDLDVYGDVVAATSASTSGPWGSGGDGPLVGAGPALAAAADWLTDNWAGPDAGVWLCRGRPARLVASAVQAWAALDGMVRRAQRANPLDLQAAAWHQAAREVLAWLEADGVGADGGLRRDPSPADHPDAALLRVAWRGPWPPAHPVVARTVDRTLERLASGPLIYRLPDDVDDGRPGPDSPDLVASLWAVRALARLQRWEEAHERFEAVLALAGPLGLLSEAADPVSGELLSNYPAAAAHLAVIDAAVALAAGPR